MPGLLATVAFTEIIRDNDPDEWENGEASLLHFYATESLARFPASLVETVQASTRAMPDVVTEFAETTDEELARLIATELDDYVAEA